MTQEQFYVLGFMFSPDRSKVVLIKKNRPPWQAGKWNGVGGKYDIAEEHHMDAMVREFREETGLHTTVQEWEQFALVSSKSYYMSVFRSFLPNYHEVKTTTDEEVEIASVEKLCYGNLIPNLRWLIPLGLDKEPKFTNIEYA